MHVVQRIAEELADYRRWIVSQRFLRCRLVHYCGPDMIGSIDVAVAETDSQIEGLLNEGFSVSWSCRGDCLYLKVWEFGSGNTT
jgi:hypothetical protein